MTYLKIKEIVEKRFKNNQKRLIHSLGVVDMALELNEYHHLGLDPELIKLSGILHDYAKSLTIDEQIEKIGLFLSVEEVEYYKHYLPVVHSLLGRYLVEKELGIKNEEILDAIYYHTTGKPKMSLLTKLIFVSDAVERNRDYPNVEYFRNCCFQGLDYGVYQLLKGTIELIQNRNQLIEKTTFAAYKYYEEKLNEI